MKQKNVWFVPSYFVFFAIFSCIMAEFEELEDLTKISSDDDWKIINTNNLQETILKRETGAFSREIDDDKIGCWKYCVKKRILDDDSKTNDPIKRVNIIWNIVDEARVKLTGKTSNSWAIFSDQEKDLQWESSTILSERSENLYHDDPNCELYLELGCKSVNELNLNISTIPDEFSNSDMVELVSKNCTVDSSSDVFVVNKVTEELRILAFGELSQAVLEIPIARRESTDAKRTRPMFSLSHTNNGKGLFIDVRNPPPGEWRLNISGKENSNYNFTVTSVTLKRTIYNFNVTDSSFVTKIVSNNFSLQNKQDELDMKMSEMVARPQRVAYPRMSNVNYSDEAIKSYDPQSVNERNFTKVPSARALILETTNAKFSRNANSEAELTETVNDERTYDEDIDENGKIVENSELDEYSKMNENIGTKRKTIVDLNSKTELILKPGTIQDIVFTVTNNQPLSIRHIFQGSSKPIPYIAVLPPDPTWIGAGETINVAVRIRVLNVEYTEPNLVTLYVRGNDNFEVVEKSTYVYVEGSAETKNGDSDKPNIAYSYNDNCSGKLSRDRCARSRWSVEITIDDPDSGLKRVTSLPSGIEPRTEFIAGTKNKVIFYYSSTCCFTTVDITATDVVGNSRTQTIDVTAWDNLSSGEIAAIVVGSLLILLLVIFIILIIIYCVRKRKSHNMSYSQRYGSRTPASAERTNF